MLTAAHCILPGIFMVRLGEHDFSKRTDGETEDFLVTRSTVHEHYDKSLMINDIAILDISRDVKFNGKFNYSFSLIQFHHRIMVLLFDFSFVYR